MIIKPLNGLFVLILFISSTVNAQKVIAVLGSSTAEGTGASSIDSGWVVRLYHYFNKNNSDGLDTNIYNLAVSGYTTYHVMATGFTPPGGRPSPDPAHNITAAMAYNPDIVLVNLPSNDQKNGYTVHETMDNLRSVASIVQGAGKRIFVTTAQPRDDDPPVPQNLKAYRDSVFATFGTFAVDFWSDLVTTDGLFHLKPEVSWGDGVHINDLGHFYVYSQVVSKNIFNTPFPLPVKLLSFTATSINKKFINLSWKTTEEEENSSYVVERSADGIQFKPVTEIKARGTTGEHQYTWTDANPLAGHNYYRLRIVERAKQSYSSTVDVNLPYDGIKINTIIPGSQLTINMYSDKNRQAVAAIHSTNGQLLSLQPVSLRSGTQQLQLPFHSKPGMLYILEIVSGENQKASFKFIGPE